ncbi:hypothetical protein BH23CHL2_BH23CHL2_26200 [soil metagenome]
MTDNDREYRRLASLLQRLLQAETGDDGMICHDGGFRYTGDFMSMDSGIVEPAALIGPEDIQQLQRLGLITGSGPDGGEIRVTEAGRRLAFEVS